MLALAGRAARFCRRRHWWHRRAGRALVNRAAQSHNKALTTASAEVNWINGWSTAATFEGEFSDVSRFYAGKGAVRYQW